MTNPLQRTYLTWAVFLCFIISLGCFQFAYHEFWKDEWQAWFVATDTATLKKLWDMLAVEGHPPLWFLLLRFSKVIANWISPGIRAEYIIQTLHFLLTATAAWLLFFRFRFPLLIRLLIALSYFFLFEYGVINRGYILVILFLFALVPFIENPKKNLISIGLLLFFLTQTEVYGLLAAGAVTIYIWLVSFSNDKKYFSKDKLLISISFAAGALLFFLAMLPIRINNGEGAGAGWVQCFESLYSHTLTIGFDPPVKQSGIGSLILSLILLMLICYLLKQHKPMLVAFVLFSFGFLIFTVTCYTGGPRQWGLHFIFLVFALHFIPFNTRGGKPYYAYLLLLALMLPAQLIYSFKIVAKEKKYLFSNAIEAGHYINDNIGSDVSIIGINKPYCTPVIGYSGHKCFALPSGELFSYATFREKMYLPTEKEILDFYDAHGKRMLYVLSYRALPTQTFARLKPVIQFDKPSIREEDYYLYKVE